MTRTLYAGRIGDTVASLYQAGDGRGRVFLAVPADAQGYPTPVVFTVWDEPDGTQITDLLAADGTTAITTVTVPASDIQVPGFYGPDGLTADVWLKDPAGAFFRMDASPDAAAADAVAAKDAALAAAASVPGMWQPSTVYTAGSIKVAPDGSTLSRLANGTSRPSFDSTEKALWQSVLSKPGTIEQTDLTTSIDARVPAASTTAQGKVELATTAETTTGTDASRSVTPAGLKAVSDLLAPKASPVFTGAAKMDWLGVGYLPLPSAHNPVYVQVVMDATDIEYPGGVGDNIAQQYNNIWRGDVTVRGTVTVTATGGTAAWTIGGQTATIAYNASAAAVQTALRALSSVGAGAFGHSYIDVTSPGAGTYVVAYTPRFLTDSTWSAKQLTVDGTNLTGPSHAISLAWTGLGGADTGFAWGSNDYNVTATGFTGMGRLTGRLTEIAQVVTGDIGYAMAGEDAVSWVGASAGGTINRIVGRRIQVGYHLGADPTAGKADEVYGLYVNGITPSRSVTDAVTTSGSATVTSAAVGLFTAWDVNKVVTGTGIPANTYITAVTSSTSITLSNNCTASGTIIMTIAATAQATNAYCIYAEAGRSFLGGQVQIQPQSANETALKVTARSGVTSGTVQEWFDGSGNSKARVDALGYIAAKHDILAREGDASGRQVTIGGITLLSVAYAAIQFGSANDAYIYRTRGGALALGDQNTIRLGAFATAALTGTRATNDGAGALAYNYETNRAVLAIGGAWATLAHVLSATATLDFTSIAAGATQELTITVTGAAVGDMVTLGPPAALEAGLVVAAGYVSAANTVKIRLQNSTGSAIDPASATWKVGILR